MRPRPLFIESLESRRLLAVLLDPISTITVDEGQTAAVTSDFFDTTPGGSYTARVRWQTSAVEETADVSRQPTGSNGPLRVRFDYRFADMTFFDAEKTELLDVAAEILVGRLNDSLAGFVSSGNDRYDATFLNPATGVADSIANFSVAADEIVVFIGARDLPNSNLATAGAGGGTGTQPFFDFVTSRGQSGVPQFDFAPWGGAISFDNEINWHTELSTAGLIGSENDFLSVAVHELAHILGFTSGVDSFNRYITGTGFAGPNAIREYDGAGSPPLESDRSHWLEGLQDNGQETLMDPTVTNGQRKLPTELDFAALDDLGWELRAKRTTGQVTDTHVYQDNGSFTGRVRINNSPDLGLRNFQVTVRNVNPTISDFATPTGRANTPIQLTTSFFDPGSGDTHTASVVWGDGTPQETLTVNQSARTVAGQHVYAQPGTYQATIGVQDDDGGLATLEFTVVVTPPPRGDWQNPANQFDVNNNQAIDPLDALLVINELNNRVLSDPQTGLLPPAPNDLSEFIDVNGDDIVAPQDALLVINELPSNTNRSGAGRGPAASSLSSSQWNSLVALDVESADDESARAADQVFADFSMSWLHV